MNQAVPEGPGPVNNNCIDRTDVFDGVTPYSTIGATTDGPAHGACLSFGDNNVNQDIWFNYVASQTGSLSVQLCVSDFDTRLALYSGTNCPVSDANLLACNDDFCGVGGLRSSITINVTQGDNIKIRVGGYTTAIGSGELNIGFGGGGGPCPNVKHDCGTQGGPGCSDEACCNLVCGVDPFCCQTAWDGICVSEAADLCGGGGGACPNPEHTCDATGGPGCSDADCCNTVCAVDPFCCNTAWDRICVGEAADLCGGGGNPACPNPEHSCDTTGGPGCSDEACCNTVCNVDPFCCETAWDRICVGEAADLCGGGGGACPNPEHDCGTTGTPGCSDAACCNAVCAIDPFCCETAWDGICVSEAADLCGIVGGACPNPEHDCGTQGGPGCSDEACCNTVCAVDPFCCNTAWDGICVDEATQLCGLAPCTADCPPGAVLEQEACGQDTNGGCNSIPPGACQSIECDDTVCGTFWAAGGTRDTDWFCFTVTEPNTTVTWSVVAQSSALVFLVSLDCQVVGTQAGSCPWTASALLGPGTYYAFVATSSFDAPPCDSGANNWVGTLTFDNCGAPCPGDINGDGVVDMDDLLLLLRDWGPCK